jgi:hypothetical protein
VRKNVVSGITNCGFRYMTISGITKVLFQVYGDFRYNEKLKVLFQVYGGFRYNEVPFQV